MEKTTQEVRLVPDVRPEPVMIVTMIPASAGPQVAKNVNGSRRNFLSVMTALYENPKPHVIRKAKIKNAIT
jgi:hypothetical protein